MPIYVCEGSPGQEVLLTGKFHPNTWTDKDGVEHQDLEIIVNLHLPRQPGQNARAAFLLFHFKDFICPILDLFYIATVILPVH